MRLGAEKEKLSEMDGVQAIGCADRVVVEVDASGVLFVSLAFVFGRSVKGRPARGDRYRSMARAIIGYGQRVWG